MKIKIWTHAYSPFMMGGNVHAPIMTEVESGPLVEFGKGFNGFVVHSPGGFEVVVERTTGAICGTSLEQVRQDVAECGDIKVMLRQLNQAARELEEALPLDNQEFWGRYEQSRKREGEKVLMAKVSIEDRSYFDCPSCGHESQTSPDKVPGQTVVCAYCGATHRVDDKSYQVLDWNQPAIDFYKKYGALAQGHGPHEAANFAEAVRHGADHPGLLWDAAVP